MRRMRDNNIQKKCRLSLFIIISIFLFPFIARSETEEICNVEYQKQLNEIILKNSAAENLAELSLSKTMQKLAYAHYKLQKLDNDSDKLKFQLGQILGDDNSKIVNALEDFKTSFGNTQEHKDSSDSGKRISVNDAYLEALIAYSTNKKSTIKTDFQLSDYEIKSIKTFKFKNRKDGTSVWKSFVGDIANNFYRRRFVDNKENLLDTDEKFLNIEIPKYDEKVKNSLEAIKEDFIKNAPKLSTKCRELLDSTEQKQCNLFDPFNLDADNLHSSVSKILDILENGKKTKIKRQDIRYKGVTFAGSCDVKEYDPETGTATIGFSANFENMPLKDKWNVSLGNDKEKHKIDSQIKIGSGRITGKSTLESKTYTIQVDKKRAKDNKLILSFDGPKGVEMFKPGEGSTKIKNSNGKQFAQYCDFSEFIVPEVVPEVTITLKKSEPIDGKVKITATLTNQKDDDTVTWYMGAEAQSSGLTIVIKQTDKEIIVKAELTNKPKIFATETVAPKPAPPEEVIVAAPVITITTNEDKDSVTLTASVSPETTGTFVWTCPEDACPSDSNSTNVKRTEKDIAATVVFTYGNPKKTITASGTAPKKVPVKEDKKKDDDDDDDDCKDTDAFDNKDSCAEDEKTEERKPLPKKYMPPLQQPMMLPPGQSYMTPGFN